MSEERKYLKAESKKDYHVPSIDNEDLKTGSLMRIADSLELIAKDRQKLIDEKDRYQRLWNESLEKEKYLLRIIRGLKGTITKMRKAKNSIQAVFPNSFS